MKNVCIAFDEQGFKEAQQKVKMKKEAFEKMISEANKLKIEIPKKDLESFRVNPTGYFESAILQVYERVNVMRLSFEKLVSLIDIDVKPFYNSVANYQNIKIDETKEVNPDQYKTFATSTKQIERFNDCMKLIEAAENLKKYRNIAVSQLTSAFPFMFQYSFTENKIRPSISFVLNG